MVSFQPSNDCNHTPSKSICNLIFNPYSFVLLSFNIILLNTLFSPRPISCLANRCIPNAVMQRCALPGAGKLARVAPLPRWRGNWAT